MKIGTIFALDWYQQGWRLNTNYGIIQTQLTQGTNPLYSMTERYTLEDFARQLARVSGPIGRDTENFRDSEFSFWKDSDNRLNVHVKRGLNESELEKLARLLTKIGEE